MKNKDFVSLISIRKPCPNELCKVAEIHRLCFPESLFTVSEGRMALSLYEFYHKQDLGILLIAKIEDDVVGYVAGSVERDRFWKLFCSINAHRIIYYMLPKVLLQANLWKMAFSRISSIRKISEADKIGWKIMEIPKPSLMSIAVKKNFRNKGIGKMLNRAFLKEIGKRGGMRVKLGVKSHNLQAIRSYSKSGWEIVFDDGRNLIMAACVESCRLQKKGYGKNF